MYIGNGFYVLMLIKSVAAGLGRLNKSHRDFQILFLSLRVSLDVFPDGA